MLPYRTSSGVATPPKFPVQCICINSVETEIASDRNSTFFNPKLIKMILLLEGTNTIYFHLPSRDRQCKTVYGVACYRQMNASDLRNRTSDVTRSTVQKSVCVLSRLPLYGLIKAKLELITHAYFDEKDFSKVELLEDTYKNLCIGLTDSLRDGSQVFLDSLRVGSQIVLEMDHRNLYIGLTDSSSDGSQVLFFGAPVEQLNSTILSVLSLFPGMIEFGLEEATSCGLSKQISPTLYSKKFDSEHEEFLEICYHDEKENSTHIVPGVNRSKTDPSVDLSINTQVQQSVNEEPQSPTISRGCELDASFNRGEANKLNTIRHSHFSTELPGVHRNNSGSSDSNNEHHHSSIELPGVHRNNSGSSDSNNEHHHSSIELPGVHRNEFGHSDSSKHSKNLSNEFLKHSISAKGDNSSDVTAKGDNSSEYTYHPKKELKVKLTSDDVSTSNVDDKSKMEVNHSETGNNESRAVVTGSNPNSPVIITNDESPLSNVSFVTLEAVQTGKTISPKDSVINIEEYSEKFENEMSLDDSGNETSKLELSLNLEEALLHRSDSIEELDSPESILKIDREDCFSWEEDRLLLTIKDDTDSRENSGEHPLENVKSHDMMDSNGESTKMQQIGDKDNMHRNLESNEIRKDEVISNDVFDSRDTTADKSLKTSPSVKASALKNKLSSAFGGWNVKEKVRAKRQSKSSTPSPTSEIPIMTMENVKATAISVIQQDDCGLPLLIFTKRNVCGHQYQASSSEQD
ncbi:hypothetical protein KUTeg_008214 [Tegillarca granosa]|uniref:AVL9/DENND6 domain-containing protein n=1 Tax=Tegillarca granosa TaxID=220873 RepID=A0ABQ9F8G9_TEGGR|nr:hypothetical protein KUTeg_008214 [Tegillarca granosa]